MEGFKWPGHNRQQIHVRAKSGSGVVALLMRTSILEQFQVTIVSNATDRKDKKPEKCLYM